MSILVSLALLTSSGLSQKWGRKAPSLDQILKESQSDLIFIGEIEEYGRSYSPGGKDDSTTANYRVIKVIKGDSSLSDVLIKMPGHIGFGGGQTIVFGTIDSGRVYQSAVSCPVNPCFFALFDWNWPYTRSNEAKVLKTVSVNAKKDTK